MTTKRQSKEDEDQTLKQLTLRIPVDGWKRLAHAAIDDESSVHSFIIKAINAEFAKRRIPPIRTND